MNMRPESPSARPSAYINDLPLELLEEILYMWRCSLWMDATEGWVPDCYAWVRTLAVCRYWYSAALRCTKLWSHIHLGPVGGTRALLEQSGRAPLHVKGEVREMDGYEFESLILVLRELPRIRSLTLHYRSLILRNKVLYWFLYGTQAPLLRSIQLNFSPLDQITAFNLPPLPWKNAPALTHVNLCHFNPALIAYILLPSITYLRLTEPLLPWSIRTITDLCHALQRMPHLEVLELTDKGLEEWRFLDSTVPIPALLPALHFLSVEGHPMFCQVVLRGIRFPRSASVSITQDVPVETERDTLNVSQASRDAVIQAYASKINGSGFLDSSSVATISIRVRHVPGRYERDSSKLKIVFEAWAQDMGSIGFKFSRYTPLFLLETAMSDADFLLRSVCNAIHVESVRAFYLDDIPNVSRRCWIEALRNMKNLRTLCIVGSSADELPEALFTRLKSMAHAQDTLSARGPLLCPSLDRLILRDVAWQLDYQMCDCGPCCAITCDQSSTEAFATRLHRCLAGRKVRQAAIRRLDVRRGINFGAVERDRLSEHVSKFVWDGVFEERTPHCVSESDESDEDYESEISESGVSGDD